MSAHCTPLIKGQLTDGCPPDPVVEPVVPALPPLDEPPAALPPEPVVEPMFPPESPPLPPLPPLPPSLPVVVAPGPPAVFPADVLEPVLLATSEAFEAFDGPVAEPVLDVLEPSLPPVEDA